MLQLLYRRGTDYVVIGGCAVGAYAQLQGEAVFSADLDIMTTSKALHELLTWAPHQGVEVVKVPQPRSIPVAVLQWRKLEVNVLTGAPGLPGFGLVARMAREFELQEHGIVVPIADPLDLLANKLVAGRDKDRAHIVIIRSFVEAEIVSAFEVETGRQRVMLARRYLEVLGVEQLEEALAERLLPLAKHPVDFRFLAGCVPTRRQAEVVVDRARVHDTDPDDVQLIVSTRTFDAE
jgi:hypothetical protein